MSKHIHRHKSEAFWTWGILFNPHAWWVGVHYSAHNKRYCINLIPCLTVWVALPGGKQP